MADIFAGIDAGSSATKAVLIDADGEIKGYGIVPTALDFEQAARRALQEALKIAKKDAFAVRKTVSCGYGRRNVDFADAVKTEIACHAKGAHHAFSRPVVAVDIGGRDTKVICVDQNGEAEHFKINARCASGTGAFLEDISARMHIPIEQMNALAETASSPAPIGAYCTVFAAGEVLAAARKGLCVENILLGVYDSMAKRVMEMISVDGKIVLTGGVAAHNPVLCRLLSNGLGQQVETPPHPQLTGALGAALIARTHA
jgi:(R)-2-hydroxyacyl-CoA dehydratese activating ATPase